MGSRTMRAPLVVFALVVAGLLATTVYVRQQARPSVPHPAVPRTDNTAVSSGTLPAGRVPALGTPGGLARDPRQQARAAMAARARDRRATVANNARIKSLLVASFRGEAADAGWAATQRQALTRAATLPAIADAGAVPDTLDVQCKRTICRLEAGFAGSSQADDWVLLYMASTGGLQQQAMVSRTRHSDGSVGVTVYGKGR